MVDKAPVLTDEQITSIKVSDFPMVGKHSLERAIEQAVTDKFSKLIEEKDKRIQEMESWYDQALDWREWEVEQSEKRIAVLEASLADVKNQCEQVRKETAQDIIDIIERLCPVCAVLSEYNTPMIQELTGCRSYMAVKSKYGIK